MNPLLVKVGDLFLISYQNMEKSIKDFIPELHVSVDEYKGDRELVFQDLKDRFGLSEEEFEELLLAGGVSDSGKKGEEPKLSYRKEAITRMSVDMNPNHNPPRMKVVGMPKNMNKKQLR